jgi:hypothetical protein
MRVEARSAESLGAYRRLLEDEYRAAAGLQ